MYVPILNENRSGVFDLVRYGYVCIVDENSNVLYQAGDSDDFVFYRSASKPIQALPIIQMGLDKKYGLTDEEVTIISGSHVGMPVHEQVILSILKKTGFEEDMLVMKETFPTHVASNEERIKKGLPRRKAFHNCAGKHCALLMIQRELGGDPKDYWKTDSLANNEIEKVIKEMSEVDEIKIGIDGCGVPVFSVPIKGIANAYKNLACIDTIKNESLRNAALKNTQNIANYPDMMRGEGYLCSIINYDPNIVGKGGANGVYGFGLKKERLGVSFKFVDGNETSWPFLILEILRSIGALSQETEKRFEVLSPKYFTNDNDLVVGERESLINISI